MRAVSYKPTPVVTGLLAACVLAAGCSASSDTRSASSSPAPNIAYDGPETALANSYPPPGKTTTSFTIGYMDTYGSLPAFKLYETSARAEIEAAGGKILVKDDQLNVTNQVNNCATLLSQGVNAIILFPLDPKALKPCFDSAMSKGVKVLALNTPPRADEGLPASLQTDIIQGYDYNAYLRAKAVADKKPGSSYAILGLGVPVAALSYYNERQKYWADRFGLKFLGEIDSQTDDAPGASTAATGLLGKYPRMGALFAYNDNAALAASTVARASSRSDLLIIGTNGQADAVKAVQDGRLFATVVINAPAIGTNAAVAAMNLVINPSRKLPKYVTTPIILTTAKNADKVTPYG